MSKVLILNFGSQYSQLIAKQIRQKNVFAEVYNPHKVNEEIASKYDAMVISGGPSSVNELDKAEFDFVKKFNKPILGICFGMQLLTYLYDGKVETGKSGQYGPEPLSFKKDNHLISNKMNGSTVWMSHFDEVVEAPKSFSIISECNGIISAIANEEQKIYATQFHPEVSHSVHGSEMIDNFLFKIANLEKTFFIKDRVQSKIEAIQNVVKDEKVILGLSGGVDSSVAALLLHKAIGDKLTCIYVDHGLMRKNESEEVMNFFKGSGINVLKIDHSEKMFKALEGVSEPEAKRKIIGREFVHAFEEAKKSIKGAKFLAQGTIYSDVIESSKDGEKSHLIKSHHNVGGLPEEMELEILEPLKDLFKDEVRELGLLIGLDPQIVNRHPFPGPGLGIRIIGDITKEKVNILQEADHVFIQTLKEHNLYGKVAQAACVLTNTFSVGVQGDERTYERVLAIRVVDSKNFMTASFSRLPIEFLAEASRNITNQIKRINRVVYDITNKPPSTIEWE